jgi:hypothetical protein
LLLAAFTLIEALYTRPEPISKLFLVVAEKLYLSYSNPKKNDRQSRLKACLSYGGEDFLSAQGKTKFKGLV